MHLIYAYKEWISGRSAGFSIHVSSSLSHSMIYPQVAFATVAIKAFFRYLGYKVTSGHSLGITNQAIANNLS